MPGMGCMRAALYARVSTEDQAREGYSLDAQIKRLELYCKHYDFTPAGRFIDDGYSGRNTNRPEYQRMMSMMDEWDILLVMKMDRIHRNSVNFTTMMDTLNRKNKEFVSFEEKFNTKTAMGRFVMDIMQRIAQLESEQIGERVFMGMKRKAESTTGNLGSGHPYGYEYTQDGLRLIEEEASVVRTIYGMSAEGCSLGNIAKHLNDSQIPAKKGGEWNKQSVHKILRNPLYTGRSVWNRIERNGEHEAIISPPVFGSVNGGSNA